EQSNRTKNIFYKYIKSKSTIRAGTNLGDFEQQSDVIYFYE
ncbi:MAG: hypothetical protein ACI9HJ_001100, partial [Ulvibacter sp.]